MPTTIRNHTFDATHGVMMIYPPDFNDWLQYESPKYGIEEIILDELIDRVDVTTFGSTPTYLVGERRYKAYLRFIGSSTIAIGATPAQAVARALKEHMTNP